MQTATSFQPHSIGMLPLEDLGTLQSRYLSLSIAQRAERVLQDAEPALQTAERILNKLAQNPLAQRAISRLRADGSLISRMRSCEARGVLMDNKNDFLQASLHKVAAWRRTMERISMGEGLSSNAAGEEFIASSDPIAMAIFNISHLAHYLSITRLILSDIARTDKTSIEWTQAIAEMRRCATIIADYEFAAGFTTQVN